MMLILLYYLSQNPNFPESVKPLMSQLKNSEQMLKFLNDLSQFSDLFSVFQKQAKEHGGAPPPPPPKGKDEKECKEPKDENGEKDKDPFPPPPEEKEKPQSSTSGIADKFIEECLEKYFKKR